MAKDFDELLDVYADLILKVGINLQEGQRLRIGSYPVHGPHQVPFDAVPLVRRITEKAYQIGASLVEVFWGDDQLTLLRYKNARRDTFGEVPSWVVGEAERSIRRGDAVIFTFGYDPYLLRDVDPELLSVTEKKRAKEFSEVQDLWNRNTPNWVLIPYATPAWAATVFPDLPIADAVATLWDYIVQFCRLDKPDPIRFWQEHNRELEFRSRWLTKAQFESVHLRGPGTDLTIRLPRGHKWVGGAGTHKSGFDFLPNIPTEEIFTLPDRAGVDGHVLTTKPFVFGGVYIGGMRLKFEEGKVVDASATEGEDYLTKSFEIDDGACRLGEIALVPHSSPISQSQIFFNYIIFDENASAHLALGFAYRYCITGGKEMNKDEFIAAGGNVSAIHRDFMIGSAEFDVDGIGDNGFSVPLMRAGEWAF